jgi:hypothetical protein
MRTWRTLAAIVVSLALISPVSAQTEETAEAGMVLVGQPDRANYLHVLRRVDLETRTFVGRPISISINNHSRWVAGGQINFNNRERPVALAWRDVEPGYYAWVEANVAVLGATVALPGTLTTACLHTAAPVFLLERDEASLIRVDDFTRQTTRAADEEILAEFDRAVAERQRAFSERTIVQPIGMASWPEQSGMAGLTRNCHEPDGFEFVASEP